MKTAGPGSRYAATFRIDSLPQRGDFAHENRALSRHRVAIFKIAVDVPSLAVVRSVAP